MTDPTLLTEADLSRDPIITGVPVDQTELRQVGMLLYTPARGAVEMLCLLCGKQCWVGPKQREVLLKRPQTLIVCMLCIAKNTPQGIEHDVKNAGGEGGTFDGLLP